MKFVHLIAFGGLVAAIIFCPAAAASEPAASLQHLFTDKDCESMPGLLGDWQAEGDLSGTWTLQKLGEHNYRLIQQLPPSDASNRPAFDLCVAHLGGYLFFDATFQEVLPDGKKTALGDDDNLFWIPLHLIGRLDVEDDSLQFRLLSDEWLQDALKAGRVQLTTSEDDEGQYILTAPSEELKEFAAHFASDAMAFSCAEDFVRSQQEASGRYADPAFDSQDSGSGGSPSS